MIQHFSYFFSVILQALLSAAAYLNEIMTSTSFLLNNIVFSCGIVILLCKKPVARREWRSTAEKMLCCLIVLFASWALLRLFWDSSLVGVAADFFTLLLFAVLFCDYTVTVRTICSAVYLSTYILMTGIGYDARYLIEKRLYGTNGIQTDATSMCLIIVAILFFLRRWHISKVSQLPSGFTALMLTISVISALLQVVSLSGYAGSTFESNQDLMLVVNISFLLVQLMAYYLYYTIGRQISQRMELMALQHKEELNTNIMETARQTYESLSVLRHEIKNHDAYMAALLEKGDYDGLRRYFSEYQAQNREAIRFVRSGNPQVDSIVNNRITRAKMLGVEIETMLAVPPQLSVNGNDLCSLLFNLLDNAIEGTVSSGTAEKPTVLFTMRQDRKYLFLQTVNPVSSEVSVQKQHLSLITTKSQNELHGYGTKIIRTIAEKYHGAAKFQVKDGRFVVDVMIQTQEEKL